MQTKTVSRSIIVSGDFNNNNKVWNDFLYIVKDAGLTVLQTAKHEFYPYGFSGVVIVGESHVAIHTFPENNEAWVEIATCGEEAGNLVDDFEDTLSDKWVVKA